MESDKSESYKTRQKLMYTLEIPTISEAKERLGDPLARIVLQQCPEELRTDFGLAPPLRGPGDELWVSPSDLLEGKVCLKPPYTQKCIQALTHQGILELGYNVECKFLKQMSEERRKALDDQECMLKRILAYELNRLLEKIKQDEHEKYLEQLKILEDYNKDRVENLVNTMLEEMKRIEQQAETEKAQLNATWEEKLKEEVQRSISKMAGDFLSQLGEQERFLVNMFQKQIRDLEREHKCAIDTEKTKCKENLLQIKHRMECRNIANLMYLLCKERRKCKTEMKTIVDSYDTDVHKLKTTLRKRNFNVKRLTRERNAKSRQIMTRERCLIEILKQFQKFINFALKAWPTQAEFFLNIDKMMRYEIDDYCLDHEFHSSESSVFEPELANQQGPSEVAIVTSHIQEKSSESHLSASSGGSAVENDALPAVYLNDRMYVREDFRDMLLSKIKIDKKHKLWNPDMEELMTKFKTSIENDGNSDTGLISDVKSQHSRVSSVKFLHSELCSVAGSGTKILSNTSIPDHEKPEIITTMSASKFPVKDSPTNQSLSMQRSLLQATDSVILAKEHSSCRRGSIPTPEYHRDGKKNSQTSNPQARRASIQSPECWRPKMSQTSQPHSRRSSIQTADMLRSRRKSSGLQLARDSVVLYLSNIERKSLLATSSKIQNVIEKYYADKSNEDEQDTALDGAGTSPKFSESKISEEHRHSKIALHRDSLEIIPKHSSSGSNDKYELPEDYAQNKRTSIAFSPRAEILTATTVPANEQSPTGSIKPTTSKRGMISKKKITKPKAKVAGDRKAKQHLQTPEQFTKERINSLVNLIKDDPSLIRMFTSCSKQCP